MSANPHEVMELNRETPAPPKPVVYLPHGTVAVSVLLLAGIFFAYQVSNGERAHHASSYQAVCTNNLRQVALALQMYHDQYKAFPPAYTVDASGKPLHSWRTLILPFMIEREGEKLYQHIDLTKPWDDPGNAALFALAPHMYQCLSVSRSGDNLTTYLASVGPKGALHPTQPRRRSEIKDDILSTLMVIEVPIDKAVPWMSPQDADEAMIMSIQLDSRLAHSYYKTIAVIFADGTLKRVDTKVFLKERRGMITIDGEETVELD